MAEYKCPLCEQSVSKQLYEKITGIWKEKEQQMKALEQKEKDLEKKAKENRVKFEKEKEKLKKASDQKIKKQLMTQKKQFDEKIKQQKEQIKIQKEAVKEQYQKRLVTNSNKVKTQEKQKLKQFETQLKMKLQKDADMKFAKESKKLKQERAKMERQQKIQIDKNQKLSTQMNALQKRSKSQFERQDKKIKSLQEQLKKNETPQMLGLLEEKVFLESLQKKFPNDKFDHTGKGGDIIHYIIEKEQEIGKIVYELKKVSNFSSNHIEQTVDAKQKREADYGILVTNAKHRLLAGGFAITKGVIVVHPAGVLVLVSILREHLIEISRLKLNAEERKKTISAVLDYIQSPKFSNSIEKIIVDTKDLYYELKKEVGSHLKQWHTRLEKYREINVNAHRIEDNVVRLFASQKDMKQLPEPVLIDAIKLPEKID